jgi:hypothetical protein
MNRRCAVAAGALMATIVAAPACAHEGPQHQGGTQYHAVIDDFHANPSTTDATGEVFLTLNHAGTELNYTIVLDELLQLKANPLERTGPDDIIGIHLHLDVPGTVGPHLLNIFGLATYNVPAEEDAELVIDYEHQTLTGKWDLSDATRDPVTGELLPQFFPLTSKVITDWIDELNDGELMVAVHTNESGFPVMAIHGHIHAIAPEPDSLIALFGGWCAMWAAMWRGGRSPQRKQGRLGTNTNALASAAGSADLVVVRSSTCSRSGLR